MARKPRSFKAGVGHHVMNRSAGRMRMFQKGADYAVFEKTLSDAHGRFGIPILAYVVMPNHFHLVLQPKLGQEKRISDFMKWLQMTHTQRWHAQYDNAGEGRLYQGRFKAFPIQAGFTEFQYLRKVIRYVERNPLRAKLVERAEDWRWGSLWRRGHAGEDGLGGLGDFLAAWPEGAYPGDARWLEQVNGAPNAAEEAALAVSLARGRPFGSAAWVSGAVAGMGLEHTVRPAGRPRKAGRGK